MVRGSTRCDNDKLSYLGLQSTATCVDEQINASVYVYDNPSDPTGDAGHVLCVQ